MENTEISWTAYQGADGTWKPGMTFNPWWGCVRVSEACRNCYAETFALRWGVGWGPLALRRFAAESAWKKPRKWNADAARKGERPRVFCASMGDVFEQLPVRHPDWQQMEETRGRLWQLIEHTSSLDWLLLTKRPENIRRMVPIEWTGGKWPRNAWIGTTAETQADADRRIPLLLESGQFAPIRFVSAEPLLERVDLSEYLGTRHEDEFGFTNPDQSLPEAQWLGFHDPWIKGIDWVIAGGESGPKARPMLPTWVRQLRSQCVQAGVSFHFKQWGEYLPNETDAGLVQLRTGKKAAGRTLDGREWLEFPTVATGGVK